MIQYTLSIVKPHAVKEKLAGKTISYLEAGGLEIVAMKYTSLSPEQAKVFYCEHKERSFFQELVQYSTLGPFIVQILKGENAIARNRDIMGATDPKQAAKGTIRNDLGRSISENVVHGSDSEESAKREIGLFFATFDY